MPPVHAQSSASTAGANRLADETPNQSVAIAMTVSPQATNCAGQIALLYAAKTAKNSSRVKGVPTQLCSKRLQKSVDVGEDLLIVTRPNMSTGGICAKPCARDGGSDMFSRRKRAGSSAACCETGGDWGSTSLRPVALPARANWTQETDLKEAFTIR